MDNDEKKFVRLGELVNATFRVKKVWGYKFKMWDNQARKMLVSDTWQKGYRKMWDVDTDKGQLSLSSGQLGTLLEATCIKGEASLIDKVFEVKSNGKTGMDIRYFFNVVRNQPEPEEDIDPETPLNLDDIPF